MNVRVTKERRNWTLEKIMMYCCIITYEMYLFLYIHADVHKHK